MKGPWDVVDLHISLGLTEHYSQTSHQEKYMISLRHAVIWGLSDSTRAQNSFCVIHYSFQSQEKTMDVNFYNPSSSWQCWSKAKLKHPITSGPFRVHAAADSHGLI